MYNAYATYTVYFASVAEFEFASSFITDPAAPGIRVSPVTAAALFGIEWPPPGGPTGPKGFIFYDPYRPNINIPHPGPSGVILDPAIDDAIIVPGQLLPGHAIGDSMALYWCAQPVVRGPEYSEADPTLVAPIPPRRWAFGAEGFSESEMHPQASTGNRARDASRVVNGFGIKIRNDTPSIDVVLSNSEGANLPTKKSWERFYFRIRKLGTGNLDIWKCSGDSSPSSGARLVIDLGGTVTAFNLSSGGVNNQTLGSFVPALNTWYRIDILLNFATGVGLDGLFRLYVNGVSTITATVPSANNGIGGNQNHRGSILVSAGGTLAWEVDLDDWHNAEIPNIAGVEFLNSLDWIIGTHVRSAFIDPLAGSIVNWTGAGLPILDQFIRPDGSASSLTSTTALAQINAQSDASDFGEAEVQDASGVIIGPACAAVGILGTQSGGAPNNGDLGYSNASGADTDVVPLSGPTLTNSKAFFPSGSIVPYPIEPFISIYRHGNSVSSTTVQSLTPFIQYIGLWGPEDGPEGVDPGLVFNKLLHNCRYPEVGWSIVGPTPDAPVCVVGGTYVGNSTFQDINVVLPFHILIIRNITSAVTPIVVSTTMFAPEAGGSGIARAGDVTRMWIDENGQAKFTVTGTSNRCNLTANTYQYFAFCDPGMRYVLNGEFNHGSLTGNFVNPLIDTNYLAQFGMFMQGPGSGSSAWMKGIGHTAQEMTTYAGTLISDGVQFDTGSLLSGPGASAANDPTSYTLFRNSDGSSTVMVQTITYIGNGVASRVIPLTPISTRFPLIAIVVRRGSAAIHYRDPSHAGSNSCNFATGANTTTGITAGNTDSITVGSTLNVNGAIYDVLVIPGSGSGWLNGTFCGPNGSPPGTFWLPDPDPLPPGVAVLTDGGLTLGDVNPLTLLKNVSGIYTLVPDKHNDTMYDRQTGQSSIDMEIPDPTFKTGYVGG